MKRKDIKRASLNRPRVPMADPIRAAKLKEGKVLKPGLAGTAMRYHKETT